MLVWTFIIIILTTSMIVTYYVFPSIPELLIAHAYAILLVSLAMMYKVYWKMETKRVENLLEQVNYLKMRVGQLEEPPMDDIDLKDQESEA